MSNNNKKLKLPFVSVCTPTFNRRPFIPFMIKCFEHQTYPKEKMEWIIVDDGFDPIEDLVKDLPCVKYYKYDKKMTLGKKRNVLNSKASGSILVYMDDDDYYPPERVMHAVEMLQANPRALCAGTSEMHLYFKHIQQMYQFGPYGPNHSTAATFAFRRELLSQTKYDETSCLAEERVFLKDYTVPFVQLEPCKSILVISHAHNSFDKRTLLDEPNQFMKPSRMIASDFIKEPDMMQFYMNDIDTLLETYEPGSPVHKHDVNAQILVLKEEREKMMRDQQNSAIFKMEMQLRQEMQMQLQHCVNHYEQMLAEKTRLVMETMKRNKALMDRVNELEKYVSHIDV
jgi:glycosyltransferase involved in cell wall biosynthesis